MSFPSFRTAAAAAILTTLLGLSVSQVDAQPLGEHRVSAHVETTGVARLWLWISELWKPTRIGAASLSMTGQAATSDLSRGMTIDPNG